MFEEIKVCLKVQIIRLYAIIECVLAKDIEYKKILKRIMTHSMHEINYSYIDSYKKRNNDIYFDDERNLKYVIHNEKKMYFKRSMTEMDINKYYNNLCLEQDVKSPHLYMTEELKGKQYSCVLDVGAAEGNFSLDIIDQAEEVYLFESDSEWVEALRATFSGWKDKIHIINAFVSDSDTEENCTIDTVMTNKEDVDLIKMDVEGAEVSVIKGATKIIEKFAPILLICTYHYGRQEKDIRALFDERYTITNRSGYLVFLSQKKIEKPILRKAVLHIERVGECE